MNAIVNWYPAFRLAKLDANQDGVQGMSTAGLKSTLKIIIL